jgi:hypothetical protein
MGSAKKLRQTSRKRNIHLRAEIRATADALVQSQAVFVESQVENDVLKRASNEMESQSILGTPVSSGTLPPTSRVNICGGFVRSSVHPDISIPLLTTELDELLTRHSKGRPDRYAVLLFQGCVPEEIPRAGTEYKLGWIQGKCGLPVNLQVFLINTVSRKFLSMTDATRKSIKDRVNEYLSSPRKSGHGFLSLM